MNKIKTINEQLDATSRSYEWEIKNTPSKRKRQNRRRKEGGKTR